MNNYKAIIQGLIFVSGDEGVTVEQLVEIVDIEQADVVNFLTQIQNDFSDDSNGVQLVNYANIYKFVSKAICFEYVQKLFQVVKTNDLSQSALETLAIVAYKQPITRVEIEEIRGVGCDMMLRKLAMKNMVREQGRSDAPGRPILYEVTSDFLDSFKLISLDELPNLPNFSEEFDGDELFE